MKHKILPWIIALSAFSVSGSAAFYSVSGLGKMFAGASLQVMILAGSLEFAKLVTASLLYEYWKSINKILKYYLLVATLILIVITSAGIYGFLSSAYQETAFKVQNQDKNVELLDKDIKIISNELSNYEKQVNQKSNRLSQLTTIRSQLQVTQDQLISQSKSTGSIRTQIKDIDAEIKRIDGEVSVLNDSISSKNSKIFSIESKKLETSSNADLAKEVGPLKYIASLTGKSLDQVVNWYIIVLMLVFDPLAIALVLAANFAFSKAKENTQKQDHIIKEDNGETKKNNELEDQIEKSQTQMDLAFDDDDSEELKISDLLKEKSLEKIPLEDNNRNEDKYHDEDFIGHRHKHKHVEHPKITHVNIDPLRLK
jgi:hypothetical protein